MAESGGQLDSSNKRARGTWRFRLRARETDDQLNESGEEGNIRPDDTENHEIYDPESENYVDDQQNKDTAGNQDKLPNELIKTGAPANTDSTPPAQRLVQPNQVYDDPSGTAPTEPEFDSDQLKQAEESGGDFSPGPMSTSTAPGKVNFSSATPKKNSPTPSNSSATKPGKQNYDTSQDVPPEEKSLYNSSATKPTRFQLRNLVSTRRRQVLFGAGGAGTITGLAFFFTLGSGPLQFIHFSQLLTQFHFTSFSNTQDGRFLKEVRFFRYARTGQLEKTRLNFFANNWADRYETKLSATGLSSAYSPIFQNFDGYVIDESQFKNADGTPMKEDEIKASIKSKYGVDVVDGSTLRNNPGLRGRLVISSRDLNPVQNVSLTYGLLRDAGLNKIAAANGARLLIVRDGVTLHPLKIVKTKGETAIEIKKAANQIEENDISKGSTTEITTTDTAQSDPKATKAAKASAATAKQGADEVLQTGQGLSSDLGSGGGEEAVTGAKNSIFKSGLTGGLIYGTACIANSINNNADNLKQSEVVKPLIRMAMWIIATGEQMRSGQGVDLTPLGEYSNQLSGVDSSGKKTSWIDSESIQANLGHPQTGVAPDDTLKSIGDKKKPFQGLIDIPGLTTTLNVVCSAPFAIGGMIISFFGGELESVVAQGITQYFGSQVIQYALTRWAGGHAIDPAAVGADRGNEADFGSTLAANEQAVAAGATPLSQADQVTWNNLNQAQSQQDFNSHSIAYRLFNPYDERSTVAKMIDSSSTSFSQNIAKMGSAILNVGHLFSSISKIFTPSAHAASAPYDYGFPIYGFSPSQLNDPSFNNPYQNADDVVGFLQDSSGKVTATGQAYIDKANKCFGVTIAPDAAGDWGVTSQPDSSPELYASKYPKDCTSPSGLDSTNWQKLRFFIMDTETAEAMSCYAGDSEACTNIGYSDSASSSSSPSSSSGASNFINPFPGGWAPNRLDMGYDGTFTGQIVAPFSGTITYAGPFAGWKGSLGVIIKANSDIGLPTRSLFFTEGVKPLVTSGQQVTAGAPIADPVPSPYGNAYKTTVDGSGQIEWGVSQDGPIGSQVDTYAVKLGTCTPAAKAMVLNFATWAENNLGLTQPIQTSNAGCP